MQVDRWAGGRTCRRSGRAPCRLSCLVLLLSLVVSECFQSSARQTSGIVTAFGLDGHATGKRMGRAGQGSLAGPEGLSPKIATPGMGEKRAGWLLKPNNKALAQAQTQAQKPEPSSGLFGDGIGTRGDERRESVPRSQGSIWSQ